ncbi:isoprenyl transferase [Vampirovibrio sp.]|uniref:isoprenyl transferase n=1 Tax=Vampirovibrio sp. TaxID=2717857 RepID=UPI0035930E76
MTTTHISPEFTALLQSCGLKHVAIIMDGNRRWAKQKLLPGLVGHKKGVDALRTLVRFGSDHGLQALTVFAFSTENWQRSTEEVGYLMRLFVEALSLELAELHRNNVQIRFIGELSGLPEDLRKLIQSAHTTTATNTGLNLQIATNYGGRQEITQAMQALGNDIAAGKLKPEDITEALIQSKLYTQDLPDLDLLIRTGGESRLSNYLLWQSAYAEFYVTETLWPDFSPAAFEKAVQSFAQRERRYGQ